VKGNFGVPTTVHIFQSLLRHCSLSKNENEYNCKIRLFICNTRLLFRKWKKKLTWLQWLQSISVEKILTLKLPSAAATSIYCFIAPL
jgi:hypothetical protein